MADKDSRGRYNSCKQENVKLLEKKRRRRKDGQENKYKQMNPFVKQKDVRKI